MQPVKIGSRSSKLALCQVEEVVRLLGGALAFERVTFTTQGDKDKITALTSQPAQDFFTDTLDTALLKGEIDIAVHSAKDLPKDLRPGLAIFALTVSIGDADAWVGKCAWNELPAAARIGTSSLLRQGQVRFLRPDLELVEIRGTIEERLELVQKGVVDGIIVAACALKRLGLEDAIKDILPWEGMALQGQLAVVGRANDGQLQKVFEAIDVRRSYGRVVLVGAGPGDPDLITVKAIKALEQADCVFYDYLVDKDLLKYAPQAEHIYAGKRKGDHTLSQDELSRLIKVKALEGKDVVRLKGGDPLVFGRGADEILYLNSYHIDVDVVPGISSATGIPSYLGVPLTARGVSQSVAFVSAHEEDEDKTGIRPVRIPSADTLIFLMGLTKLKEIVEGMGQAGWVRDTPVMIISNGTRPDERIVQGTLADIEKLTYQAGLKPPALIVAGNTVNFYKARPQKALLHCGTNPELYTALGRIVPLPMIEIKTVALDAVQCIRLNEDLVAADLVVLTSPSAVRHFMKLILGLRPLEDVKVKAFAVIGRHTARILAGFGITPQIMATEETAQGLFKAVDGQVVLQGKKILLPRSSLPNPFLKEALEGKGAVVAEWTVYFNSKPEYRDLPSDADISGIVFTSPSTVTNFLEDYESIPGHWEILAKGPVTEQTLKQAGYTAKVIH